MTAPRLATIDDATTCAHLLEDFNNEYDDVTPGIPFLEGKVRSLLASGDTEIALTGDPAFGISVMRFRESIWFAGNECYLAELFISRDQRGKGFGKALLMRSIEVARERGAHYMDLATSEDDVAARALYTSLGFSRSEGIPNGSINFYFELNL